MVAYLQRYGLLSTLFLADVGLLLLSIFLFLMASDYPPMARKFPRLVLVMIMIVTLLDMIHFLRSARKETSSPEKNSNLEDVRTGRQLKVLYMSVLIFIYFFCLLFFGLALGTLFFLLFSGWTLGYRHVKTLLLSSVAISAFVYIVFEVIMQSFLPEGFIFSIFGG